jgi:hypothetical protein
MGFTLWNLMKATLLVLNALAVLHPWRFLYPKRACCAPVLEPT